MTTEKLTVEFLPAAQCRLTFNENGFIIFTLNGENKGRVKLVRSYPFSLLDEYICVCDLEDKEIGIIRDLKELDEGSRICAVKHLEARYYCPTVTAVKSVKERMGNFYFETVIDGKDKNFTVRDITRNMRFANENNLLIFDVDGNRYVIPDFEAIEQKSKKLLEPYLY